MERRPEDIAADPVLREEFVAQESWDEYIERQLAEVAASSPSKAEEVRLNGNHPVYQYWNYDWRTRIIDPATNVDEIFYLAGYTEKDRRMAAIDQQHAALREAAARLGVFEIESIEGVKEFKLGE